MLGDMVQEYESTQRQLEVGWLIDSCNKVLYMCLDLS